MDHRPRSDVFLASRAEKSRSAAQSHANVGLRKGPGATVPRSHSAAPPPAAAEDGVQALLLQRRLRPVGGQADDLRDAHDAADLLSRVGPHLRARRALLEDDPAAVGVERYGL